MYKRSLAIFFILFAVTLHLFGEGLRDTGVVQRNYTFSDFDSISVNGSFRVKVINSEKWDIHIFSSREDQQYIKLRKNNNIFELSMLSGRDNSFPSPVVVISMPVLKRLILSGAVQMEAGGFSSGENLSVLLEPGVYLNLNGIECSNAEFLLNGSCELHAFFSAETINIVCEGNSIVRMGGRAVNLTIDSNGRARIDGSFLLVDNVYLLLVGISEIRITPDIQLNIESKDKAVIYYSDKYMDNSVINKGYAILKKY